MVATIYLKEGVTRSQRTGVIRKNEERYLLVPFTKRLEHLNTRMDDFKAAKSALKRDYNSQPASPSTSW